MTLQKKQMPEKPRLHGSPGVRPTVEHIAVGRLCVERGSNVSGYGG